MPEEYVPKSKRGLKEKRRDDPEKYLVEIDCNANKCRFNKDGKCTATSITVEKGRLLKPTCWSYDIEKPMDLTGW